MLAAQRGDHAEARARFAEGLPLLRRGGDLWDLALLLLNSGLEEAQAASPMAGGLLTEALRTWQQLRGRPGHGVGARRAGRGRRRRRPAAPRWPAARRGPGPAPGEPTPLLRVIVPYDLPGRLAAARTRGDPAAFDRGLAEGQGWTIDRAVAAGLTSAADPDVSLQ